MDTSHDKGSTDERVTEDNLCPSCHKHFVILKEKYEPPMEFCPLCGSNLHPAKAKTVIAGAIAEGHSDLSTADVTLVKGLVPEKDEVQFAIGPYQVMRSIGKGGMGEVYLAYDTSCGRRIALKRIREDLNEHKLLHNRFLKEARITSQLTHPAIIPIYAIHTEADNLYYTMPFVEGQTLKQIFRKTRIQEKKGEKGDHLGSSIPALVRIFISVCQAVAYAHAKGVLHRDLKPENIIVGPYGEVLILDWGLAKLIHEHEDEEESLEEDIQKPSLGGLTRVGKVVGTLSYMAPERALGQPASLQTEVYALGVTLYQILTLHVPFNRGSLKEFRKNMHKETIPNPTELAPYRDVPRILSRIVHRCLSPDPTDRFHNVDELIHSLENYIEGRSEWFQAVELDIAKKEDWEFQENVLIAEQIAITRGTEMSQWVNLMISKASFTENTKLEARVLIGKEGNGIGFLMSVPEPSERAHLNDGYCLWLGTETNQTTRLLRSTVEVVDAPEVFLDKEEWHQIRIEKIDSNIYFYLNDVLQFSYISHLPLVGTHVGLLAHDADFEIEDLIISVGSQNITVNCLAIPDAFLGHKDYDKALTEYRRIGYSFPGRAEGREAMFRAGVTLLEQLKEAKDPDERDRLFDLALEEFEKLHSTPGAPLEYLGKALVYRTLGDYEEEIKCFELACRRYKSHPLLPVLQEQIVYRLHEAARYHRKATYQFILLTVRHLPKIANSKNAQRLFSSLQNHWESLSFIEEDLAYSSSAPLRNQFFSVELAFWLAKPLTLIEVIDDLMRRKKHYPVTLCNALFCLIELGAWEMARNKVNAIKTEHKETFQHGLEMIEIALQCHQESPAAAIETFFAHEWDTFSVREERVIFHLIERALIGGDYESAEQAVNKLGKLALTEMGTLMLDCAVIKMLLLQKRWKEAGEVLHKHSTEELHQENSLLNTLYGCWLVTTEGEEIAKVHFSGALAIKFPRTWTLLGHYVHNHISEDSLWFQKAFLWEKRQLYQQLALYAHCSGDAKQFEKYCQLEGEQYVHVRD